MRWGVIDPRRGSDMARDGSSRGCSGKPRVSVSSAAKRIPRHSVLVRHDTAAFRTAGAWRPLMQSAAPQAYVQKDSPLVTNHSLALTQEGPLATAFSNREPLELEHASTH